MLDIRQIRENPDAVQQRLNRRGRGYDLAPILTLDQKQRELETTRSELQAQGNAVGKDVGQKIKGGADPKGEEIR
ncbi:MAG: hypothetical protein WBA10_00445, partial [Elainellaceae cyanobacterium]